MGKDNSTDSYVMDDILSPNFYSVDFYQKRKKGKYRLTFAPDVSLPVCDTHCHIEMFDKPEWTFIRAALHNVDFLACVVDSVEDGKDGLKTVEQAYEKATEMLSSVLDQVSKEGSQAADFITISQEDTPMLCLNKDSVKLDAKIPDYKFIIGVHPHNAKDWDNNQKNKLIEMLKYDRATCIGEIGLDFHYDLSPRDKQIEVFKEQLIIAKDLNLPVSLHIREAHDVALGILNEIGFNPAGTLLHCFNLGPQDLKPWVDAGCYIAIGGPVTFKKSDELREAVSFIPKDKLLTETDAPFMTPEPLRGDVCFPDHVIWTAKTLCEITDNFTNKQEFYNQLHNNALALLGGN